MLGGEGSGCQWVTHKTKNPSRGCALLRYHSPISRSPTFTQPESVSNKTLCPSSGSLSSTLIHSFCNNPKAASISSLCQLNQNREFESAKRAIRRVRCSMAAARSIGLKLCNGLFIAQHPARRQPHTERCWLIRRWRHNRHIPRHIRNQRRHRNNAIPTWWRWRLCRFRR